MDSEQSNYEKYRGKCKEFCDEAIKQDSTLTIVRGHYWEPFWDGLQAHWWTVRPDGTIYDPTRLQFPSEGNGTYIPFNGMVECAQCGKEIKEEDAEFESNYAFCSYRCRGKFVGVVV